MDGAETLTLPDDADILVAAATAVFETAPVLPWCDLYDRVDRIPFDKLERFFKDNLK